MTSAMAYPTVPPRVLAEMVKAEATPMNRGGVESWTIVMTMTRGATKPTPAKALLRGLTMVSKWQYES